MIQKVLIIITLLLIAAGCEKEKPLEQENGTTEEFTIREYNTQQYPDTKNGADSFCRDNGYQFATEYYSKQINDGSYNLGGVTCWKP